MSTNEHNQCLYPERWKQIETMAEQICDIHERLFVDNGTDSHQTQLKTLKNQMALIAWAGGVLGSGMILGFIAIFFKIFNVHL